MKIEKKHEFKGEFSKLPGLECVMGFQNDFLAKANNVCKEMQEKKRFTVTTKHQRVGDEVFYMAEILYGEKVIISERYGHMLTGEIARPEHKDKLDHEPLMGKVIYMLLLHMVTAGLFQTAKASEESKKMVKELKGKKTDN